MIQDLRGLKGIALAEGLLKILDEAPVRNAGVVIFEQARDGFNLSVTVDLLLQRGEKRYLIHTKRLPDQFVRILKDQGTEVILLRENAPRRSLIEDLLQQLNIPVSFGHFSFRIPEEGAVPGSSPPFPPSGQRPAVNRSICSILTFHPTPCLSSRAAWGDVSPCIDRSAVSDFFRKTGRTRIIDGKG